jgi:segregation and condensation protein B
MNDGAREEARRAIEAILMVADEPVDAHLLAQLVEISPAELSALMSELAGAYLEQGRGFVLAQVAGGYRFQSDPDMAPYVERFVLEGQSARLSSAAMETMAIIAYKQPISRAQVAAIRGVNVDGVVRTLEQRGYIAEVARDAGPGQAVLFGTTPQFLERMGINAVGDLPPVADFVPGADVVEALELGLRITDDADDLSEGDGSGEPSVPDAVVDEPPTPTIDIDNL